MRWSFMSECAIFVLCLMQRISIFLVSELFLEIEVKSGHDIKNVVLNCSQHLVMVETCVVHKRILYDSKGSED